MRKFIISIIRSFTNLISYIIPVNDRLVMFVSYPDFADNSYAVFRHLLVENNRKDLSYCWLVDDQRVRPVIYNQLDEWKCNDVNIRVIPRKSITALWLVYRSRYIFNTVGLFIHVVFHQKDKRINMWHGMPLKKIYSSYPNGNITIATSEMFAKYMAQGLMIDIQNVLVIGQPRNDLLYKPFLISPYLQSLIHGFDRIGIWMPTFRRSYLDKSYSDGSYEEGNIAFISFNELQIVNDFLVKHNTLLIIKLHPLDILQQCSIPKQSNILLLKNDNFDQKELYPLLATCDFLISDYSSVLVDYEILKRPIGVTIGDQEQYKNSRGLFIDDFPGIRISDIDDFLSFIAACVRNQVSLQNCGNLYNLYRDDKASERLLSYLNL